MARKKTDLEKFLDLPENMHAREQLLMHRLFLDVKTAAAYRGYYLNTYFDNVDHDGFDVIFDDQDYIKKIQVKSVQSAGKTGSWSIHKRILRPSLEFMGVLGFPSTTEGQGSEGGVVLIEFSELNGEVVCGYYYTDVFVLTLFFCGFVVRTSKKSQAAVNRVFPGWRSGPGTERIVIPKAAFLKAKNPTSLLALMGLHNGTMSAWKDILTMLAMNTIGLDQTVHPGRINTLLPSLWEELGRLWDEPQLEMGRKLRGGPIIAV